MAHYVSVTLVVKDQQKLEDYFKVGGPAVAKHGGKPFAGGPETKVLQQANHPTRGVVLEFSTAQQVEDWLNDPELAEVHALRDAAADVTILSLPEMP